MKVEEEDYGQTLDFEMMGGFISIHDDLYQRAWLARFSKSRLVANYKTHSIYWHWV